MNILEFLYFLLNIRSTMDNLKNKRITLIANPTSQRGGAKDIALFVMSYLSDHDIDANLVFTRFSNDARDIAKDASPKTDLIIAIGGDGLIHEIMNGLMEVDKSERADFGLIPAGTGNDYARSLNMSLKPKEAIEQLFKAKLVDADLGVCNDEYYAQTLSFGLDAAIGLGSVERRIKTGKTGTRVFFDEGIYQLRNHLDLYNFKCDYVDAAGDSQEISGETYMFAAQIGKTYGGGFKICPKAEINNGFIECCYVTPKLNPLNAIRIFVMAKDGHHTRNKRIHFFNAKSMKITIEGTPKIQMDGEPCTDYVLNLSVSRDAVRVLKFFED